MNKLTKSKSNYVALMFPTIALTGGGVSFDRGNETSIGPEAVIWHWPVLLDQGRSVELTEILIGSQTVRTQTALPG